MIPKLENSINLKAMSLSKEKYREIIEYLQKVKRIKKLPMLVIIVGESGSGKSTFCKAMNCKNNWFVSSKLIVEELKIRKKSIAHDNIHELANEMYSKNPMWQVSKILKAMEGKDFLFLDGPRRIKEVNALIEKHPATLIVKIEANVKNRLEHLIHRDNIKQKTFQKIVKDEFYQTQLNSIFKKAFLTIENNGTLFQIQKEAKEFKQFLLTIKGKL